MRGTCPRRCDRPRCRPGSRRGAAHPNGAEALRRSSPCEHRWDVARPRTCRRGGRARSDPAPRARSPGAGATKREGVAGRSGRGRQHRPACVPPARRVWSWPDASPRRPVAGCVDAIGVRRAGASRRARPPRDHGCRRSSHPVQGPCAGPARPNVPRRPRSSSAARPAAATPRASPPARQPRRASARSGRASRRDRARGYATRRSAGPRAKRDGRVSGSGSNRRSRFPSRAARSVRAPGVLRDPRV